MPGEYHTFEIMLASRSSAAGRQGVPKPPDARLDTTNILNPLGFRQFFVTIPGKAAVSLRSRNMNPRGDDKDAPGRQLGSRIDFGAPPERDSGAAQ